MKYKISLILLLISSLISNAQNTLEQKITTDVTSATVFLNSAQIYREKEIQLTKGEQLVRFIKLSPFIDKNSIQVTLPNIEILAINFEKNYLKSRNKSKEILTLEKQLSSVNEKIDIKKVALSVLKEEIEFLKSNRSIGGNQTLTVAAIKNASVFFSSQMRSYKTKELQLKKDIENLAIKKSRITKQLESIQSNNKFGTGEIVLKVNVEKAQTLNVKLNYNVANVSWYPSYDLRVKNINSPLEIVYKANLKQNSQVDWNNVNLTFSSANPTNSNKVGEIIPYFLGYGSRPPYYGNTIDEVFGYVTDKNGALSGVNVSVEGTTIATTTNFEGKYEIKIPKDSKELRFSYLGYQTKKIYANRPNLNVRLKEDGSALDEVVVTGYSNVRKKQALSQANQMIFEEAEAIEDIYMETNSKTNQTSFEIQVIKPYNVKSSNKDFVIAMQAFKTEAEYTYYSIPKIEAAVFLTAKIKNWERFNLLEGEANVYLENTFVGKTLLDTRTAKKSLKLSLGKDKSIVAERKKLKEYSTRQFIGNKQEEKLSYNITVKNKKQTAINLVVLDQIPVSTQEEITVSLGKDFTGELDNKTGKVSWNLNLAANTSKTIQLNFIVKYPKNRRLFID